MRVCLGWPALPCCTERVGPANVHPSRLPSAHVHTPGSQLSSSVANCYPGVCTCTKGKRALCALCAARVWPMWPWKWRGSRLFVSSELAPFIAPKQARDHANASWAPLLPLPPLPLLQAYQERSPEAMFNVGFMHEWGLGVPQARAGRRRHACAPPRGAIRHGRRRLLNWPSHREVGS